MLLFCPECQAAFTGVSRCPRCSGLLLMPDEAPPLSNGAGHDPIVLVKATPAGHQEVSQFPAVSGKTWNNAAISNGLLLVRNTTEMACFRIAEN